MKQADRRLALRWTILAAALPFAIAALIAGLVFRASPVLADDANNFKPTAGVSVDWRIHKTTGSLLVSADGQDYVVSAAYRLTIAGVCYVVADANCSTLTAWPTNLVRVGIVPEDANSTVIRFAFDGNASSATPALPTAGILSMPLTPAKAAAMRLYSVGTTYATLFVMTPRN
ncbi:MAG: hypothetical protein IMZ55_18845 [Acidobacteria bacterium]|nr:hypothetical protein [Acidobacteriota bacterium]